MSKSKKPMTGKVAADIQRVAAKPGATKSTKGFARRAQRAAAKNKK